jgi:hypothetical protein
MKPLLLVLIVISSGCYTYQNFVEVPPRTDIPNGTTEFFVATDIPSIQNSLRVNTIAYTENEVGIETQEIILDEGTRAKYSVYQIDTILVKVVPFWGYTDRVKSEVAVWAGYAAASTMSNEMTRIVYKKTSESRPKKVFDYGVYLFEKAGTVTYKK